MFRSACHDCSLRSHSTLLSCLHGATISCARVDMNALRRIDKDHQMPTTQFSLPSVQIPKHLTPSARKFPVMSSLKSNQFFSLYCVLLNRMLHNRVQSPCSVPPSPIRFPSRLPRVALFALMVRDRSRLPLPPAFTVQCCVPFDRSWLRLWLDRALS